MAQDLTTEVPTPVDQEYADQFEDDNSISDQDADDESEAITTPFILKLSNPLYLFIFLIALFVDSIEIILDLIGLIGVGTGALPIILGLAALFFDGVAFFTVGAWLFFRTGKSKKLMSKRAFKLTKKAGEAVAKTEKMAQLATKFGKWGKRLSWIRFLAPLFELVPYISIIPAWTVAVYLEIKYNSK